MWWIDAVCERHIQAAQQAGELDNLPGTGKPLHLDDDSAVPETLRAGYRLLKNAGYVPPALAQRKEAITLRDLLANASSSTEGSDALRRRLRLLTLNLQLQGLSTDFLQGDYGKALCDALSGGKIDAPPKNTHGER